MKKLKVFIVSIATIVASLTFAISPVAATGDCVTGAVWLYNSSGLSGDNAILCYGVNDTDIESDPGLVIGPQSNGTYRDDWIPTDTQSGVSSVAFTGTSSTLRACIYNFINYGGSVLTWVGDGVKTSVIISGDNLAGSVKWVTGSGVC